MHNVTSVELTRDIEAVQIPHGTTTTLPKGTPVDITQTLGGTYTVHAQGALFRVATKDADALGIEATTEPQSTGGEVTEQRIWDTLRTCYDPEIPVNIVDLGLIYDCHVEPLAGATDRFKVDVKMTLTAPGCGMGPVLQQDVSNKLLMIEEVDEANVELVWDPQWNQGMMTEAAKLQLGLL